MLEFQLWRICVQVSEVNNSALIYSTFSVVEMYAEFSLSYHSLTFSCSLLMFSLIFAGDTIPQLGPGNLRTVKIDCPDIAQERRDYFLAFRVRNRGKPGRYNIKLEQEGSACYTPYR